MPHWTWTNWAGNQVSDAPVVRPKTLEDLIEVVRKAPKEAADGGRRRIRATGGSYSWSPLVPDTDLIIDMKGLDKELNAGKHPPNIIEVECGISVEELTRKAHARGMTLVSPTLFPRPTMGGAIGTGSHGTDSGAGGFADQVVEMTIVRADGSVHTLDRNHPDLEAAKVALGSFGIVYSVKLELVPGYNVITETRSLPIDTVLGQLPDLLQTYEFVEFFWFPFQDTMPVYLMNRTDAPPDPKTLWSRISTKVTTVVEDVAGAKLIPWIARHAPALTPLLSKLGSSVARKDRVLIQEAEDAFHFQNAYPKCWDCSYAVPIEHGALAWQRAIDVVNEYAEAKLYPVNLALHGRFTGASDALIAPDHGRPTCYVEVTTAKGTPHWLSFFREVERRWTQIPGARPHWGKLYWELERIHEQYPLMPEFLEARERWDPERVFLNDFLENEVFRLPERDAVPS